MWSTYHCTFLTDNFSQQCSMFPARRTHSKIIYENYDKLGVKLDVKQIALYTQNATASYIICEA